MSKLPQKPADVNPIDFLRRWEPEGPWLLTAIVPDGRVDTRSFGAGDEKALTSWLDGERNHYFSVNRPRDGVTGKASKPDIGYALALHVDVDPRINEDFDEERARIMARIEAFEPRPSVVIDSGGGYQAFWLLREPAPVEDGGAEVEGYNRRLEALLEGDHCHDVSRIMRLPGTTNNPTEKKRAAGRIPAPTALVRADWDLRYDLEDFETAGAGPTASDVEVDVDIPADAGAKMSDLGGLPDDLRRLIEDPRAVDDYKGDRSRLVYAVATGLVRLKWSNADIADVLLFKDDGPISKHVHKQGKGREYAKRQIARARAATRKPTEAEVREFAEEGDASNPGSYASALVSKCIAAGLSIVKVGPIFKIAARHLDVNTTELKALWRERSKDDDDEAPTQGAILLGILDEADLWHDQDKVGFATFKRDGHRESVRLKSKRFKEWLNWRFHTETGKAPAREAIKGVIANAEARAFYDGTEHRSWIRVAEHEGRIYLDLGDDAWTIIEIDETGWRVVKDPSVRFRRGGGQALPMPVPGGKVEEIWEFINVTDEGDRKLILGWAVCNYRPRRPFTILDYWGESGSAKTTAMRVSRKFIDPCTAEAKGMPKTEDDLMVAAANNWVFSADNVSKLTSDMGDALCRLSTGGGLSKRELFTDGDEFTLDALRPIIMTGLSLISGQQDLLNRTLLVRLPNLAEADMEDEAKFWPRFEEAHPRILGALLDAVSTAIRRLPDVKLDSMPRMADFAKWSEAAGEAFGWQPGEFVKAYQAARQDLFKNVAETDLLTKVIVEYLGSTEGGELKGTATELLETLDSWLDDKDPRKHAKGWPTNGVWMSRRLNEIPLGLRAAGVTFEAGKDQGLNVYTLTLMDKGSPDTEIPF